MAKNVVSGHFSTPWASPLYPKLSFCRYSGENIWGYLLGFFYHYMLQLENLFFVFFLNMQKIGQLPHFRPPWGVNLIPTQNFCVAFHKVGCLNIIFIVKYYLDLEIIYRETNILKFKNKSKKIKIKIGPKTAPIFPHHAEIRIWTHQIDSMSIFQL